MISLCAPLLLLSFVRAVVNNCGKFYLYMYKICFGKLFTFSRRVDFLLRIIIELMLTDDKCLFEKSITLLMYNQICPGHRCTECHFSLL